MVCAERGAFELTVLRNLGRVIFDLRLLIHLLLDYVKYDLVWTMKTGSLGCMADGLPVRRPARGGIFDKAQGLKLKAKSSKGEG